MTRLDRLKEELAKVFGRLAKWELLCEKTKVRSVAQKIKLARQVLSEPCSGSVNEAHAYRLGLEGVEPMHLDDFLGRSVSTVAGKAGKSP